MLKRLTWTCCVSLALAADAGAQLGEAPEGSEPLARYHVEVIVFRHTDADLSEEIFDHRREAEMVTATTLARRAMVRSFRLPQVGEPSFVERGPLPMPSQFPVILRPRTITAPSSSALQIPGESTAASQALEPGAQSPLDPSAESSTLDAEPSAEPASSFAGARSIGGFRFRILREDELTLGDAYARMENLSAYDVLLHGGWVQEALPEESARAFDLAYLGATNPAGTITLHVSRFLHLDIDLAYFQSSVGAPPASGGDALGLSELNVGSRFHLEQQRRARSGELHYIDHPVFGVLVLVTPEPEQDASEGGPAA